MSCVQTILTNKQLPHGDQISSCGTCRALSDAAERTASVGEEGKEERRVYAAIYKRDYYVNNVDGNDNNVEGSSSGDEDEISPKKVDFHIWSSFIFFWFFVLGNSVTERRKTTV